MASNMERYKEYKDSGVQWIGEIPSHWKMICLGYLGKCQNGVSKGGDYFGEGFPFVSYSDVYNNISLPEKVKGLANSTLDDRITYSVEKGDVFFTRTSETIEEIGFTSTCLNTIKNAVFAGFLIRFRPSTNVLLPSFSKYYFRSQIHRNFFVKEMNLVTRASLSQNLLRRLPVLLPPLSEQQSIVSYLDSKTKKIDSYISAKEEEIRLLGQAKHKIIADAVTKGLNKDVEMKESGISWLGKIPSHWKTIRIKGLFKESEEKSETGEEELLSLSQYTGIKKKADCDKTGMFEAESTVGYKKVHPGQFVMNIMLAWNGSYAVSDLEGIISPAYCVFDFRKECNKKYFDYLLRMKAYAGAFKTESRGIIDSRLRLYPNKFYKFMTLFPPIEEQNEIVSYITSKTQKIDTLISGLQQEIDTLKTYKQRLISDVVTGQIKVSWYEIAKV